MRHVRSSPYYPQSNRKIERWHRSLKGVSIRVFSPKSLDEARSVFGRFVDHDDNRCLHSPIGHVTPAAGEAYVLHGPITGDVQAAAADRPRRSLGVVSRG
jgi:putative transposase